MIKLLLVALALTAVTVVIHGLGAAAATRHVTARWAIWRERPGRLRRERLMAQLVAALLLLHLAEAIVWALALWAAGALADLETATYFSLTSYTTTGYGDVLLAAPWRLLGPLEGAVGVLMFGWSTGLLVAAIGVVYGYRFASGGGEVA
jgi:hypothetical protein